MRFLCLHGMGTNADVYKAQLAPIIAQLDQTHEFVFPEGLVECAPPPAVPSFFKGPFYCFYAKPTAEELGAAYDYVREIIEDEGPFDGVMGFSQGGALAASLLLHHRRTNPYEPDLFRIAVFTCASLPFDPDSGSNTTSTSYETTIDPSTGVVGLRDLEPGHRPAIEPSEINGFIVPLEPGDVVLRRYHPAREPARIQCPTVHIMGKSDPFLPQCEALAELCAPDVRTVFVHNKEHALPRDMEFATKAAAVIEEAVARAKMSH